MCITFFCLYPYAKDAKQGHIEPQPEKVEQTKKQHDESTKIKSKKIKKKTIMEKQMKKSESSDEQQQNHEQQEEDKAEKEQEIKFVIAFNRDEQSHRRTMKMGPFEQDPNIIAGRDMKSTGTWLGLNIHTGIMVILTNYDLPQYRKGKSRGQLVKSFLSTTFASPEHLACPTLLNQKLKSHLIDLLKDGHNYSAFNLLIYNIRSDTIFYICSQLGLKEPTVLKRGMIYGLCNTDLGTLWPKTEYGLGLFEGVLERGRGKGVEEIMGELGEMMRDDKSFSNNPDDEASIFVQPYYCTIQKAQRMTKSTFIATITHTPSLNTNSITIKTRQITHKHICPNITECPYTKIPVKKDPHENYDHIEEAVIDHTFVI